MSKLVEVIVATVGKAHGIRGDVMVDVRTDEPGRRFAPGARVRVEGTRTTYTVQRSHWHSGRLMVHFEGVDDRNLSEAMRGQVLVADVPEDELPTDEEEFYDRQLVGLAAVLADGTRVGTVTEVVHLPEQDLLSIEVNGEERLVPFVKALVPRVSIASGEVELVDRPGLLSDEGIEVAEGDDDDR